MSSSSNLRIRLGTMEDLPAVMRIVDLVVPVMNARGNFQWELGIYPLISDFQKDVEKGWMYVAVNGDDEVVGVAALTDDQPSTYADCGWNISIPAVVPHRVAVREDQQGKGTASALLQYATTVAIEKGLSWIRVDTNGKNTTMQHLLKKLGFHLKGEIELEGKPPGMKFVCFEKSVTTGL